MNNRNQTTIDGLRAMADWRICSKRVVWDCPDEGLLELAKEMTETKA